MWTFKFTQISQTMVLYSRIGGGDKGPETLSCACTLHNMGERLTYLREEGPGVSSGDEIDCFESCFECVP